MLSLIITALIFTSSGSNALNMMNPPEYVHRQVAEDGIGQTVRGMVVAVPTSRLSGNGGLELIPADYTPENTIWLPELVVTEPRPTKTRSSKSELSQVEVASDGSIWLEETVVTGKRIALAAPARPSLVGLLPLIAAGAIVGLSAALGIALLPARPMPVGRACLAPVCVCVSKKR